MDIRAELNERIKYLYAEAVLSKKLPPLQAANLYFKTSENETRLQSVHLDHKLEVQGKQKKGKPESLYEATKRHHKVPLKTTPDSHRDLIIVQISHCKLARKVHLNKLINGNE
ncbi:hypothetical protein HZS_7743 [Henneguya salminicola]|nr:hypothetical protein HZS_7743 [Henneguya salminicola]